MTRCPICGHADSVHNDCANCTVSSPTRGQCPCDGTPRSQGAVDAAPTRKRATSSQLKRTQLKRSSSKATRKARPDDRLATWCEASTPDCAGRAVHRHHKRGRVGPDVDEREHTLDCCDPCHRYIHAHPAESYEAGWLERRT